MLREMTTRARVPALVLVLLPASAIDTWADSGSIGEAASRAAEANGGGAGAKVTGSGVLR